MRDLSQRRRPSKESEFVFNDPRRDLKAGEFGSLSCESCHLLATAADILRQAAVHAVSGIDLQDIIGSCLTLNARLMAWSGRAAGHYQFTDIEAPVALSPTALHPSQPDIPIHLYSSPAMASLWNQYRCMRILLLRCILGCVLRRDERNPEEFPSVNTIATSLPAVKEIPGLINGIFASVPSILGEVDQDGYLRIPQQKKAVGGLLALWPLRLLLFLDIISQVQRDWIMERLTYIRNFLGIYKATEPV